MKSIYDEHSDIYPNEKNSLCHTQTYKDDSKDCEDIYPIKMYKKNHEKATTRHVCRRRKSYKTERLYKWKK